MACTGLKTVWVFWFFNAFLSSIYCGLALTTFYNLQSGVQWFKAEAGSGAENESELSAFRSGLLAACMLGFIMVLCFMIYSCLVMLCRLFSNVKQAYGIILGMAINTAFFQLLAGLLLQTELANMRRLEQAGRWSTGAYKTYYSTFCFSYILVGTYIIVFFVLLFGGRYLGNSDTDTGLNTTPAQSNVSMTSLSAVKPQQSRHFQV